jgi:hypothetical protein
MCAESGNSIKFALNCLGEEENVCRVQISHWVQGISVDLYFSLFYW